MAKWTVGDRVKVQFGSEDYKGEIIKISGKSLPSGKKSQVFTVKFEDGEVHELRRSRLSFVERGFTQYQINWKPGNCMAMFKIDDVEFWVEYRKARVMGPDGEGEGHVLGIRCKYLHHSYLVETIEYLQDPRDNLQESSADVCAAANKWIYMNCTDGLNVLEELRMRSEKPVVRIGSLEKIEDLIRSLTAARQASLYTGSHQYVGIDSEDEEKPCRITFDICLSSQAMALKGSRIPSMNSASSSMIDAVAKDPSKKGLKAAKEKSSKSTGCNNLDAVAALVVAHDKEKNVKQQSKLRKEMRKMGWTGGPRKFKLAHPDKIAS